MNRFILIASLSLTFTVSSFAGRCEVEVVDKYGRQIKMIESNDFDDNCKEGMKACKLQILTQQLQGAGCRNHNPEPTPATDNVRDARRPADRCEVEVVDKYGRQIKMIESNDFDDNCKEGMKACKLQILTQQLQGAGCRNHNPEPTQAPDNVRDARRPIENGERVIFKGEYEIVVGSSPSGIYAVTGRWGNTNTERENLALTSGCNVGLCVDDEVYNTTTRSCVTILGLEYDNKFFIKSEWGLLSGIDRKYFDKAKDCKQGH